MPLSIIYVPGLQESSHARNVTSDDTFPAGTALETGTEVLW